MFLVVRVSGRKCMEMLLSCRIADQATHVDFEWQDILEVCGRERLCLRQIFEAVDDSILAKPRLCHIFLWVEMRVEEGPVLLSFIT